MGRVSRRDEYMTETYIAIQEEVYEGSTEHYMHRTAGPRDVVVGERWLLIMRAVRSGSASESQLLRWVAQPA